MCQGFSHGLRPFREFTPRSDQSVAKGGS
jgi:hypothetical protein